MKQPKDYAPRSNVPKIQPPGPVGRLTAWGSIVVVCLFAIIGAYTVLGWVLS